MSRPGLASAIPVCVALDPESVVRRQLSIFGVHNYEPRHLSAALKFLQDTSDRYPWPDLVAAPSPLDDVANLLVTPPGPLPRYSIAPKYLPFQFDERCGR